MLCDNTIKMLNRRKYATLSGYEVPGKFANLYAYLSVGRSIVYQIA